jgi:hypothetical protein
MSTASAVSLRMTPITYVSGPVAQMPAEFVKEWKWDKAIQPISFSSSTEYVVGSISISSLTNYYFRNIAAGTRIESTHASMLAATDEINIFTFIPDDLLFRAHIMLWHEERGASSSITQMAMCPSYQRIIAMGPKAIPLILKQMESEGDEPDMWFWALRVLTDADPVSDDARGNFARMSEAWLNWARHRYVW